jgi:histidinol-phosphate aminotransferase
MSSLLRPALRGLTPYTVIPPGSAVDLSDNTSLWGPPPAALDALRALEPGAILRYPAIPPTGLYEGLAAYAGVSADMIVAGCGSDDLIDCAMRAFAEPGDTIAFATPTFSMIPAFAAINGLRVHAVQYSAGLGIDVDALLAPNPRVTYVCSPNNPTGSALPTGVVERIVASAPGVVVLDEAYGEFTSAPGFDLVRDHERLVVMRTLSKAFGMAGLRLGYAVLAPALARGLETVRGPYKLNAVAATAATAALGVGLDWVRERASETVQNRGRFAAALAALGLSSLPSEANFLCVPCRNAERLAERLRARGFALRTLRRLPPMTPSLAHSDGMALRITIGPWPIMTGLIAALQAERDACA